MYYTHSVCKMHRKWKLWKLSEAGVFSILFNGIWRRNERNGISPLEHYSNNCCTSESLIDAKVSVGNYKETLNIYTA